MREKKGGKKVLWSVQKEDVLVPFIEGSKISSYKPRCD